MTRTAAIVCLMTFALASCYESQSSQERQNIQVAERLFGEVWSDGNTEILGEIIGDDYVKHWASFDPVLGRDQSKQEVQDLRQPDSRYQVNAIEASANMVFVRFTATGTFTGDMEGVQASGRRVEVAAMTWLRFEDGKIVEEWTTVDEWALRFSSMWSFQKNG